MRFPNRLAACLCLLFALPITGCSWFRPAQKATDVRVVNTADVRDCVQVAQTEVTLAPGTMESHAGNEDISGLLEKLARESAAQVGGNTVAATGPIDNRTQRFTVYQCRNPSEP